MNITPHDGNLTLEDEDQEQLDGLRRVLPNHTI
jgi:hypothetical protein